MNGSTAEKVRSIGRTAKISGIKTGTIARIDEQGTVWVDFAGNRSGLLKARLTGSMAGHLESMDVHHLPPVMLAFEENDPRRPVIVDVICDTIRDPSPPLTVERDTVDDVRIDGQTLTFNAEKQIVLRCGKSSITLTRAGKVLTRGAYLLNRSSGVNRIKGGSVQIN
jgi:hypothetical protein